jgi:cysteine desulfurase/selenocysteine lyase
MSVQAKTMNDYVLPAFSSEAIRDLFPFFKQNPDITFLDSAASAQKPQCVIDAMSDALTSYANVHRGIYSLSQKMTQAYEDARATIANFIHAPVHSVIFTRNATEAINLVASSWGTNNLSAHDEILITTLEHHANIVPWQMIAEKTGAKLVVVPMTDTGEIRIEDVKSLLSPRTKMVAISHMSNVLGTILPVAEIILAAKMVGALTLLDGCQSVAHLPIDVTELDCDFFVFSGHKLYGPTGIGVLYGRAEILNAMPPYQGGGDMIDHVTFEKTTYRQAPARFEAGTPAFVEAIGLARAVQFLQTYGMEKIAFAEEEVYASAWSRLKAIEGITLYGHAPKRKGVLCFTCSWGHASDIGMILDKMNIAVRVGHHCAMPLMNRLGVTATLRASIGLYTTHADIDHLIAGLAKAKGLLS